MPGQQYDGQAVSWAACVDVSRAELVGHLELLHRGLPALEEGVVRVLEGHVPTIAH